MAKQRTDGHTPLRQLRIPDDEWVPFGEAVGDRERTRVVREFMRWYLGRDGAELPERPTPPDNEPTA
ncbi:hypothetical protein [Streptomyces fumanus]|uniref:Uncharacterized protein n=1 Tax=Streptomyces fumanus TaxID=67302 RepID=A0A919A2X4_9ACTN|nr:hypothetical protein [Streptomyces fumanus]GHE84987.1 hypothetical protein GCM10018772_05170 [Streptomyces fumanus]